jgi:hypothetical protein
MHRGPSGGNGGGGGGLAYAAQTSASAANKPYYSADWIKHNITDAGPFGAIYYTWGDGAFVALPALSSPATLLTDSGPVTREAVTISYQQAIGAAETLRTGSYTKAVTFTLATTSP